MNRARLVRTLRAGRLLKPVDTGRFLARRWTARAANRRFVGEHPDFAIPPAELMFDALAQVDL